MTTSPLPAGVRDLRFDATVPRALVHRAAVAEVFLTDSAQVADDRFLVAAQLPRMHSFFNDSLAGHHDLLLLIEIARQAGVLIAHRHLGVADDRAFVFQDADVAVIDPAGLRSAGDEPSRLLVEIVLGQRQTRGDVPFRFAVDLEVTIDGRPLARGSGALLFISRSIYRSFRGRMRRRKGLGASGAPAPRAAALPSAAVGRRDERNVVIGAPAGDPVTEEGMVCEVIVDQGHPCLFDHPLDHLPGMLMLEAFRQTAFVAAREACGLQPASTVATRCRGSFAEFGELELTTRCHARIAQAPHGSDAAPTVPVELTLLQDDHVLGQGLVEVTVCT